RGHSDTEVILAAFEQWGITRAVSRFVGMFAMAVWDARDRTVTLIRDRLGIKPVFVYARPGLVTFGSELKALLAGPEFDREIDIDAVTDFLRYLYVPGPRTIFKHAIKLPPGHTLTIRDASQPLPAAVPYWSLDDVARRGLADPFPGDDAEAVRELRERLTEAVSMRMVADVPLGALLSGGIDSSTVAALMQASSSRPVKTFSIAFEEKEYNEAPHAARLARHLGTDHTEVLLTGADALAVVPRIPEIFDEPHADTSQVPALLICEVARREVTVALSGDGGDEVYGGYNRYSHGERLVHRVLSVPRPARRMVAAGLGTLSSTGWDRAYQAVSPVLPRGVRHRLPGEKIAKLGRLMKVRSESQMYRSLVSAWERPEALVRSGREREGVMERTLADGFSPRLLHRMMLADQKTYLTEDQLAKVDRVSMAVSLEMRVPLLDHRLVEFSWRLRPELKTRNGEGKWLLRQVLYELVPRELVERPKMGLSVPIHAWLRGPLRPWAEELLDERRMNREGVLNAQPIRRAWGSLLSGENDHGLALWAVLMFQAWHQRWAA
ncbi:MAG: asparagine synthase (glutamine-hydrolyzing), partial [Gemmatimonadaceae bacterium]